MDEHGQTPPEAERAIVVAGGKDRLGEHRGLGISVIDFKVLPADSEGILIIENTFHARGGRCGPLTPTQADGCEGCG